MWQSGRLPTSLSSSEMAVSEARLLGSVKSGSPAQYSCQLSHI